MNKIVSIASLLFLIFTISCSNSGIKPDGLIGKWSHTYFVQTKEQDGNWSEWHQINTLVALPTLEFTANGKILWDGKPSANCTDFTKYRIETGKILLSEPVLLNCGDGFPLFCDTWNIVKLTNDTLEIEQCFGKARYTQTK